LTRPPVLDDPLLLVEEVASLARASVGTVRHWIATGKIASLRPGRRVLVRRSELERFIAKSERGATDDLAKVREAAARRKA
jgi:excisionase family DNA binding protein